MEENLSEFTTDVVNNDNENSVDEIRCLNCGNLLSESDEFCSKCGTKKGERKVICCKRCNAEIQIGQRFCPKCGEKTNIDAKEYVNAVKNNYANKMKKINLKKISLFVGIGLAVVILIALIISVAFRDYHDFTKVGNYSKAYSVAKKEDKTKVYLENIIFSLCKEVRESYKDPSSFDLREAYYSDTGSIVLKTGGKNSYGGIVFGYDLFVINKDNYLYEYLGSESSLEEEKIYSWDDENETIEKQASNLIKDFISLILKYGKKVDSEIVDNINQLFANNTYKTVQVIDEELEKELNKETLNDYNKLVEESLSNI